MGAAASFTMGADGVPIFDLSSGGGEGALVQGGGDATLQSLLESVNLLARMMQNALELTYPEIYNLSDFEHPEARYPLQPQPQQPQQPQQQQAGAESKQPDGGKEEEEEREKEEAEAEAEEDKKDAEEGRGYDDDDDDGRGDGRLASGTRVMILNLVSSPEYNDCCGVVVKFLKDKERYKVFLGPSFNNKHLALKPNCV